MDVWTKSDLSEQLYIYQEICPYILNFLLWALDYDWNAI